MFNDDLQWIKTSNKNEKFTNKHPGAVNSPMVGTAYSAPEPGKEPFVKLNWIDCNIRENEERLIESQKHFDIFISKNLL